MSSDVFQWKFQKCGLEVNNYSSTIYSSCYPGLSFDFLRLSSKLGSNSLALFWGFFRNDGFGHFWMRFGRFQTVFGLAHAQTDNNPVLNSWKCRKSTLSVFSRTRYITPNPDIPLID